MPNKKPPKRSITTAKKISQLMLDKKATSIDIIDVRKITSLTDFFVVCTSESEPQSKAIHNHIKDELTKFGLKPWHSEGFENLKWVLLDYVDIVVHVFSKETREYYEFERLWADAKITRVE